MKRITYLLASIFLLAIPAYVAAEKPLSLEESINIALKNSNILQAAKESVNAATAQKKEAAAGFLPKFSTSYSYTRLKEAPVSRFLGLPPPFTPMNGLEIPVGTKDNFTWSIEARQPIFAGGGILAGYQASKIGEDAAHLEEKARKQDIVLEVKIAYFSILRAEKIRIAASKSVEMLTAHRNVAENFFKVGMIPKNDLLRAEVELANGRQAMVRAQNAVDLATARFNSLLKRPINSSVEIEDVLIHRPFQKSMEDCFAAALQSRPELKIFALKAEQAGKMVRQMQSEYFPTLSVVGNYSRFGDSPSVSGSDYRDADSWYLMGVASWNFWEWGKTKFRVDAGRARQAQALEAAKELNDQIVLEIKNAFLVLQEAEKQIAVSGLLILQTEENFRISEERYRERLATSTEVLDANTLLVRAKSEYANALADFNINQAKLHRATGTIWP